MPLEPDDSLGYLIHGAILEKDPRYESLLLRSLEPLQYNPNSRTAAEFDANRQYHRIKNFYHPGHAVLILGLKAVFGLDWITIWWLLAFAFYLYLFLYMGLLARDHFGNGAACLALGMFAFSFIIVEHQTIVAIREWSNVAFLGILFHMGRILRRDSGFTRRSMWIHSSLLAINSLACIGFHTLGRGLVALALAIVAAYVVWQRKSYLVRAVPIVAVLAAALVIDRFSHELLGVARATATPLGLVHPANWLGYATGFLLEILRRLYGASFLWVSANRFLGWIALSLIMAGLAIGYVALWRGATEAAESRDAKDRNSPGGRTSGLYVIVLPAILCFALLLSRLGQNYLPVADYLFLGDYVNTALFAIVFGLFAFGWLVIARLAWRKPLPGNVVVAVALCVFVVTAIARWQNISDAISRRQSSTPFDHPGEMIRAASAALARGGSDRATNDDAARDAKPCVFVDGEVPLYFWLLYGDYQIPVAYNRNVSDPGKWRNQIDATRCKYRLTLVGDIPKSANDRRGGWQLVSRTSYFEFRRRDRLKRWH